MTGMNSSGRHAISILFDRRKDGIYSIAFCPICDKAEESHDQGKGRDHAASASIAKIRSHMRLRHRVKDDPAVR